MYKNKEIFDPRQKRIEKVENDEILLKKRMNPSVKEEIKVDYKILTNFLIENETSKNLDMISKNAKNELNNFQNYRSNNLLSDLSSFDNLTDKKDLICNHFDLKDFKPKDKENKNLQIFYGVDFESREKQLEILEDEFRKIKNYLSNKNKI